MVTNITFHKITVRIESYKILELTDYEVEVHLLIGFKCIMIVTETISYIRNMTHSMSLVFCETKVRIQDRGGYIPWSLTRQDRFRYINLLYIEILVVLIPPQKMCNMFPHISRLENIDFINSWYWDLVITIYDIIFNLDWRWWSLIHQTNPLENTWQR